MKLNLRDLFWLIFVSAVATMWWIDRSKLADRIEFYETPIVPRSFWWSELSGSSVCRFPSQSFSPTVV